MLLIIDNNEVIGYKYFVKATIPDGVTSIGDWAFEDCEGLVSVAIPDSVTDIGYRAFQDCHNLKDITIPNSVTSIERRAFSGCINLIVKCHKNSYAEKYCIMNEIDYEIIEENEE